MPLNLPAPCLCLCPQQGVCGDKNAPLAARRTIWAPAGSAADLCRNYGSNPRPCMPTRTQQDYADLPPYTHQNLCVSKKVQQPKTPKMPSPSFSEGQEEKLQHKFPLKSKSKRETAAPNDPIHQASTGPVICFLKAPDHQ